MSIKAFTALASALGLVACVSVRAPPGQENQTVFVRESEVPYIEAYRQIAKGMRACYRALGPLGNGNDLQADLDASSKSGTIEIYQVGLTGPVLPEKSQWSRTVVVSQSGTGSKITTSGTSANNVYRTHLLIPKWLDGVDTCRPPG